MSKLLKYKGFYGSVDVSIDDSCLFGKLEFIQPLITYEAETMDGLRQEFYAAVDDYLSDCEKDGVTPEVACKGSFNVRIGPEMHRDAAIFAAQNGISLNDLTKAAIEHYIRHPVEAPLIRVLKTAVNEVSIPFESEETGWILQSNATH